MKRKRGSTFLFYFLMFGRGMFSQQSQIEVSIHARVDTSQKVIKEIATLWINYLNSVPDSLYSNPYWNTAEKSRFKNFDHSTPYLYQFPSRQLLPYYKPTILSIEKESPCYSIRTIFSADGLEGEYRKSNPWCITKLYAINEAGSWKLINALPVITEKWNRKTEGKITFIFPPQHAYNQDLAARANTFCNKIVKEFNFPDWKAFDFYVTDNGDEMGKLLNFDYYFAGYTTGIGMHENRILLGGIGSEYYPHEFIHLIVPRADRHGLIEEGFATWKGGQKGHTFEEGAGLLANELAKNDTITFTDILHKKWGWQFTAFYTTGAVLCQAAYEKGGVESVKQLLNVPANNEKLVDNLCRVLKIEKKDFEVFLRTSILKYRTR